MQVCLFLDPTRMFRWHLWLAAALVDTGRCEVAVEFATEKRPLPAVCSLVFELERIVHGLPGESALDPADDRIKQFVRLARPEHGAFDVTIDLAGGEGPPPARRLLVPTFDGRTGESGAIACLLDRQVPAIRIEDSASPGRCFTARPAVNDREVLAASLDNLLSSAVSLIRQAVLLDGRVDLPLVSANAPLVRRPAGRDERGAMLFAGASVARKAMRLLKMILTCGRTWSVGWRTAPYRALLRERTAAFTPLRDDGRRYYADPFAFQWQDRTFLFVEEYVYATRRGRLSVSEIGKDGTASTPRPILEEPYHLSYPFVFEKDGQIWMIPESGAARGVYLYRAEAFPFRWKREARLIGDSEAYDATLLSHDGLLWIFACERSWNSSSWDALSLFRSDRLEGEWHPHHHNPVLIDASTSRPAGAVFRWGEDLVRPVQDGSRGYGGGVVLCRIDTLNAEAFAQTPLGRIHCGPHDCHTYNQAGIEVIDVFGPRGLKRIHAFYDLVLAETGSAGTAEASSSAAGRAPLGSARQPSLGLSPTPYEANTRLHR
jgi:hypothetical protein